MAGTDRQGDCRRGQEDTMDRERAGRGAKSARMCACTKGNRSMLSVRGVTVTRLQHMQACACHSFGCMRASEPACILWAPGLTRVNSGCPNWKKSSRNLEKFICYKPRGWDCNSKVSPGWPWASGGSAGLLLGRERDS